MYILKAEANCFSPLVAMSEQQVTHGLMLSFVVPIELIVKPPTAQIINMGSAFSR